MTDIIVPPPTTPIRLVMVTGDNNNKYYNLTPDGAQFLAEWGRVGVTKDAKHYPLSKWASIYKEKVKKGYKDVTHLVKTTAKKSGYADVAEPKIHSLFVKLQGFAKTSVQDNYTISSEAVTPAQVHEAQDFVNELTKRAKVGATKDAVNKLLLDLYTVIPRRMKKVQLHLLEGPVKTKDDLQYLRELIDTEQKTLDVMAGQVSMQNTMDVDDPNSTSRTILDALGIAVTLADSSDEAVVRRLMDTDAREFRNVYRVTHLASRKVYEHNVNAASDKKVEVFWHGSRNENWISILQTGLKIRPSNAVLTGSMFGDGIYFADKYRKSAGYTSLRGSYWTRGADNTAFLALMDVHVGRQFNVIHHSHECYKFSKKYLDQKGGYHSVFAKGGYDLRNNEYIVYDDAQSSIKYLVEVGT
jgi:poly [ADP-ribose] polymerase